MPEALLRTKLYVPPLRPNLVPRSYLIKRLNQGLQQGCKLTLVSAPAGFGKTTLLSEWVSQGETVVAWVSLDEGDNDPIRFLAYLVAAIQTVEQSIGKGVLGALQSPQPPSLEAVLTALINQINAIPDDPSTGLGSTSASPGRRLPGREDRRISRPSVLHQQRAASDPDRCTWMGHNFVLILDDYHLISAQPVHDALAFLLEHQPRNLHVVVATRSDPPLHLARFRGRGQLTELRSADLRFRCDEVTELLSQVTGLELSVDDIAALASRTEGWIAGLQMAALALQATVSIQERDTERIASFIQAFTGSDRYILDYLVEEVLNRRPQGTKDFLLQTSILDRLSGPLCNAVCGASRDQRNGGASYKNTVRNDSQTVLESLEAANLFIVPLDNERRWYRYHHLFADLLRVRLKTEYPELIPTLHRRAAAWYESNEQFTAAINHYLKAADYPAVAQLIEERYQAFIVRGDYVALRGWIEALPEELVSTRPRLSIAYAWSLLNETDADKLDAPLKDVVRARATLPSDKQNENTALHGELAAIRAFQAFWRDDIKESIELSQQALSRLPPEQQLVRGFVVLNLANAHGVLGELDAAIHAYEQIIAASRQSGNQSAALIALGYLGGVQAVHGHLRQAARTHQRGLHLATGPDGSVNPMGGIAKVGLGMSHYEWNNLDEAIHYLQAGKELSKQAGIPLMVTHSLTTLALISRAQGDAAQARSLLEEAELRAPGLRQEGDFPRAQAAMTRLAIALGDLDTAERWVRQSGVNVDDEIAPLYSAVYPYLGLARFLISQGRNNPAGTHLRDAAALLARLFALAEKTGRTSQSIEILILQALLLDTQEKTSEALTPLQQALQLAEPEDYVRTFIDESASMEELLKRSQSSSRDAGSVSNQRLRTYVNKLLAAFPDSRSRISGTGPGSADSSAIVETLSAHELKVLRLIAAGLSNREAADELYVSVNTVKWHLRNIYGKLNVRGRMEASARAQELGLL
jgi:LuxR family maltose regulon positive regulatory protein